MRALVPLGALWLALAIDRWLGEPPLRVHPVAWIGAGLGWIGRRIAPPALRPPAQARGREGDRLPHLLLFGAGAAAWCLGAALVLAAAWALQRLAQGLAAGFAVLLLGLALKPLFAWRMLRDEVLAVELGLERSLAEGRLRLARLVSREVDALDAAALRESAIESLAENLNDSLVAPLFWFVLFGLPGAALYRFANTADAMWGYRGERDGRQWEWAGKWAARADDLLSWLPARLSALLLITPSTFGRLAREARKTPSPNSGWPMAAMALRLDLRLAKPGVYLLHPEGRTAAAVDVPRAVRAGTRAVWLAAWGASAALLLRAGWR